MPLFAGRSDITINKVKYYNVTPIMTSSTTPSPYTVIYSTNFTRNGVPYYCFDNSTSQVSCRNDGLAWIGLDFGAGNEQVIKAIRVRMLDNYSQFGTFYFQMSEDGVNYTNFYTLSKWRNAGTIDGYFAISNDTSYRYVRIYCPSALDNSYINELELFTAMPFIGNPKFNIKKIKESALANEQTSKTSDDGSDMMYFTDAQNIYLTDNLGERKLMGTGDYNNLLNKPTIPDPYELQAATTTTLGGVKIGDNLTIDESGVLSAEVTGTTNYRELEGKPTINDVMLDGALTTEDLKITQTEISDTKPTATNVNLWVNTTENNIVGIDSDGNEISLITTGGIGLNTRGW